MEYTFCLFSLSGLKQGLENWISGFEMGWGCAAQDLNPDPEVGEGLLFQFGGHFFTNEPHCKIHIFSVEHVTQIYDQFYETHLSVRNLLRHMKSTM